LGTGKTRSRYRWRLIDATATQGQRRTIVSSLLDESAERLTQLRAYRWTIEIVFRWLKRVVQLDTLEFIPIYRECNLVSKAMDRRGPHDRITLS
jgi:IS4 transposase